MTRSRLEIINTEALDGLRIECCNQWMKCIGTWPIKHEDTKDTIRTIVFECQVCCKEMQIAGAEDKSELCMTTWDRRIKSAEKNKAEGIQPPWEFIE